MKIWRNGSVTLKASRTRTRSCIASSECAPGWKKSSSMPTRLSTRVLSIQQPRMRAWRGYHRQSNSEFPSQRQISKRSEGWGWIYGVREEQIGKAGVTARSSSRRVASSTVKILGESYTCLRFPLFEGTIVAPATSRIVPWFCSATYDKNLRLTFVDPHSVTGESLSEDCSW